LSEADSLASKTLLRARGGATPWGFVLKGKGILTLGFMDIEPTAGVEVVASSSTSPSSGGDDVTVRLGRRSPSGDREAGRLDEEGMKQRLFFQTRTNFCQVSDKRQLSSAPRKGHEMGRGG
jgi:hypothetical protein